jgi:hypothetical protein
MSQNGNGNSNGTGAEMIRVGVIGYGYWGPNVVRNFFAVDHTRVDMLCDMNPSALARAKKNYPGLEVTTDPDEILKSTKIDAVAVSLRVDALQAGQGGARKRQACVRREAVHVHVRTGRRTDRAGGAQEPDHHGGPHVPVYRRG